MFSFLVVFFLVFFFFFEIACDDSLEQFLTSSGGKTHKKDLGRGSILGQTGGNCAPN